MKGLFTDLPENLAEKKRATLLHITESVDIFAKSEELELMLEQILGRICRQSDLEAESEVLLVGRMHRGRESVCG